MSCTQDVWSVGEEVAEWSVVGRELRGLHSRAA